MWAEPFTRAHGESLEDLFMRKGQNIMEVLDVLNLGEIAHYFSKMAMFPVFDVAYYIVSILYLKYEPGK